MNPHEVLLKESILLFTDGAAKGNPGRGGWGAIIVRPDGRVSELGRGYPQVTNNQMELEAVIAGLRALKQVQGSCAVFTDSTYVIQGINSWIWGWQRNGWRTADKKPVKNSDLWIELLDAAKPHRIEWLWVKGHAGHPDNERADQLASDAAMRA